MHHTFFILEATEILYQQNITCCFLKTSKPQQTDTFGLIHLLSRNSRNRCLHSSEATDCSRDNAEDGDASLGTRERSDFQHGRNSACRKGNHNAVAGGDGILMDRRLFRNVLDGLYW